jgi:hypothetical protein
MSQLSSSTNDRAATATFQMPDEPGDLKTTLIHILRSAQSMFSAYTCTLHAFHPLTGKCIAAFTIIGNQIKENVANGERVLNDERRKRDNIAFQVLKQEELFVDDLATSSYYKSDFAYKNAIHDREREAHFSSR